MIIFRVNSKLLDYIWLFQGKFVPLRQDKQVEAQKVASCEWLTNYSHEM